MRTRDENPLDRAIGAVRQEELTDQQVAESGRRVWQRLQAELGAPAQPSGATLAGCASIRPLVLDYRAGQLPESRALLVRDHLLSCAECRAWESGRGKVMTMPWGQTERAVARPSGELRRRWALAAGLLLTAGLTGWGVWRQFDAAPAGYRAVVASADGGIFRLDGTGERPLRVGEEIGEGVRVRTAKDSHATLRLRDGSLVEVGERAELAVALTRRDTTVQLERGNVLVEAAKRRTGHLYVATPDCNVSVTGTIFSVTSGIKGSRVGVVEGEVRVRKEGQESVLHHGDQLATTAALQPLPVAAQIDWSRNRERHLALLREFKQLDQDLRAIRLPELRYNSRLLVRLPAQVSVAGAMPNLTGTLAQAFNTFEQNVAKSPELGSWWQQGGAQTESLREVIGSLEQLGRYLGDEVVLGIADQPGSGQSVVAIADVRGAGLKSWLEEQLKPLGANAPVVLDENTVLAATGTGRPVFLVTSDTFALANNVASLRAVAARQGGFDQTDLGRRMTARYPDGVGLLVGADLQRLGIRGKAAEASGFGDAQFVLLEHREVRSQTISSAQLSFAGQRHGIASWLAKPSSMGSLSFVSAEASGAAAFVMKSPAKALDDLMDVTGGNGMSAFQQLASSFEKLDIRVKEDLAAALGGEFAIAMDGPLLPIPSWKLVAEVYDTNRLQATLQKLVDSANRELTAQGQPGVTLTQEAANGRTYYRVQAKNTRVPVEIHYTFADGYLVASASRALVDRAIQVRQNGASLTRSERFRQLVPTDRQDNFSAVVYQNAGSVLGSLADLAGQAGAGASGATGPERQQRQQALNDIGAALQATLIAAYGSDDAITVTSTGTVLGLDLTSLALPMLRGQLPLGGTKPAARP